MKKGFKRVFILIMIFAIISNSVALARVDFGFNYKVVSYAKIQEDIDFIYGEHTNSLLQGLVAHYEFEGNANDSSGNGCDGNAFGNVKYTDGAIGKAASFGGVNDYVKLNDPKFSITENLAISTWIRNTDDLFSDSHVNYIISKGIFNDPPWNDYALYLLQDKRIVFKIVNESGKEFQVYSDKMLNNQYHHIVGMYDYSNSKIKLYIDGILENETDATDRIKVTNNDLFIGDWNGASGWHFWHGEIDDSRIYDRTLSYEEIQKLYHMGLADTVVLNGVGFVCEDNISLGDTIKLIGNIQSNSELKEVDIKINDNKFYNKGDFAESVKEFDLSQAGSIITGLNAELINNPGTYKLAIYAKAGNMENSKLLLEKKVNFIYDTEESTIDENRHNIVISASGTPLRDVWPIMRLYADNVLIKEWSVNSIPLEYQVQNVNLNGVNNIRIEYPNDDSVRNLYIDYIKIGRILIYPEDNSVVYKRWNLPTLPGQRTIAWNGELILDMKSIPNVSIEGKGFDIEEKVTLGDIINTTGIVQSNNDIKAIQININDNQYFKKSDFTTGTKEFDLSQIGSIITGIDEKWINKPGTYKLSIYAKTGNMENSKLLLEKEITVETAMGKIVVNHDEWTISNNAWSDDAQRLSENIANWFVLGQNRPGKFLVMSHNFGLTGSLLANAIRSLGHIWDVNPDMIFTYDNLIQYDGIFLAGDEVDNDILIQYVQNGGNVYLAGGTGNGGGNDEANDVALRWKKFLNAFGMEFSTSNNNYVGNTNTSSITPHIIFEGVSRFYSRTGNSVYKLSNSSEFQNTIIISDGAFGLFGIFDGLTKNQSESSDSEDGKTEKDTDPPTVPANLAFKTRTPEEATLVWTASADNVGVTGYIVMCNGSEIERVSSTRYTFADIDTELLYFFAVKAFDEAGNVSDASREIVLDYIPPTAPTDLKVEWQELTSVKISWNASTDNYIVEGYDVYRDGIKIGITDTTSYIDENLIPDTEYSYTVKAFDTFNESKFSDELKIHTDNYILEEAIDPNPANGEVGVGLKKRFTWNAGEGAQSYSIRMWKEGEEKPTEPTVSNLHRRSFQPERSLEPGTKYYWQLTSYNSFGYVEGAEWSFITEHVADLEVTELITPSTVFSGQTLEVSWIVTNIGQNNTGTTSWVDSIYLSSSPVFDKDNARHLGNVTNQSYLGISESYRNSETFNIPINYTGEYYVFVITDLNNKVIENNISNNISSGAFINISLTPPPDLEVVSIIAPTTSFSGSTVHINWRVVNSGTGRTDSKRWVDRVYISEDNTLDINKDVVLGAFARNEELLADEEYFAGINVTLPMTIFGECYFFVVTDADNDVYEHTGEDNNISQASQPVLVTLRPTADLEITSLYVPENAESGQSICVTWTVSNKGASSTVESYWRDRVYLSKTPELNTSTDIVLYTHNHNGSLNAWGDINTPASENIKTNYTVTKNLRIPDGISGTYYIHVITDFDNRVFEFLAKDNNAKVSDPINIKLLNSPDYVVGDVSVNNSIYSVTAGSAIEVRWTVENISDGYVDGKIVKDKVFLCENKDIESSKNILLGTFEFLSDQKPGELREQVRTVVIPNNIRTGDYYVYVFTNAEKDVYEHNGQNNNTNATSLKITAYGSSDLAIDNIEFPSKGESGKNITVSCKITNVSDNKTRETSWTDGVYLSFDHNFDKNKDIRLETIMRRGALESGETYTVNIEAKLPYGIEGEFYLYYLTDIFNQVNDKNRQNNISEPFNTINISLSPTPDLSSSISINGEAIAGQPLNVSWTVYNNGTDDARNKWYDSLYISSDSYLSKDDIQLVSEFRKDGLGVGEKYTVDKEIIIPSHISGTYYLLVKTDSRNDIYEHNGEDNNISSQRINIKVNPPVDLHITSIKTPDNAIPGQIVTVEWIVENAGAYPAKGHLKDAIYISPDDKWDVNDILLGDISYYIDLPGNSLSNKSLEVIMPENEEIEKMTLEFSDDMPGVTPGNYYIIVRTDILNQIPETNVENNTGVSKTTFATDVQELKLDMGTKDLIKSNQGKYFRVRVPEGKALQVDLESDRANTVNELYISYGQIPSRNKFDYCFKLPLESNQSVIVPQTREGDYYILVYCASAPDDLQTFNITAKLIEFGLHRLGTTKGGQGGKVTIKLEGALFTKDTMAHLENQDNMISASNVYYYSSNILYTTFDLEGIPKGLYDISVYDKDKSSTFKDSFEVVDLIPGSLQLRINTPEAVRPGQTGIMRLEYYNPGNSDILSPLLDVLANNALMREIDGSTYESEMITLMVGAVEGPSGILPAGTRGSINIGFLPTIRNGNIKFYVRSISPTDNIINWNDIKEVVRPEKISDDEWNIIWNNLIERMGNTQNDLLEALSENSNSLSILKQTKLKVDSLLKFELSKANNEFPGKPIEVKSIFNDVPLLSFNMTFPNTITERYKKGSLGYGWRIPWDINAYNDSDGNVIIDFSGKYMIFRLNNNGQYSGEQNYKANLEKVSGKYYLKFNSGIVYAFMIDGRLNYIEDINENRVTLFYNGNELIGLVHSNGAEISISYNDKGLISQMMDHYGKSISFEYDDAEEQLVKVVDLRGTTFYKYNSSRALTTIIYPDGSKRNFEYDSNGRLTYEYNDEEIESFKYSYDDVTSVNISNAYGDTSKIMFNVLGQVCRVEDELGNTLEVVYDRNNRIEKIIAPNGIDFSFKYDSKGNIIEEVDPLGNSIKMSYCEEYGNLINITDAKKNVTNFLRDGRSNLTDIEFANGVKESYEYDLNGNIVAETDRNGNTIRYLYDVFGRVIKKSYPDDRTIDYIFDEKGNLISIVDSIKGTITIEYDSRNFISYIEYPNKQWFCYEYDNMGRRVKRTGHDGYVLNYEYYSTGNLKLIKDSSDNILVKYTYDNAGRLTKEEKGNGTYTEYKYDKASRITNLTNYAKDDSVQTFFYYSYDENSRCTSIRTKDGEINYSYDSLGRLLKEIYTDGYSIIYKYDASGNRISVNDNGIISSYNVNNLNEYLSVGDVSYSYDDYGNIITREDENGITSFYYDFDNRLVKINDSVNGIWEYEYDSLGNRITVKHNDNITKYLVDPFGLGNIASKYTEDGDLMARYIHGIGLLCSMEKNNNEYYYSYDVQGNTSQLTDSKGEVINNYYYRAFGEVVESSEEIANSFLYTGRFGVMYEENGLYFMRQRFYNPDTGAFLSIDPIRDSYLNLYTYAYNNPISFIDPSGLKAVADDLTGFYNTVEDIYGKAKDVKDFHDQYNDPSKRTGLAKWFGAIRDRARAYEDYLNSLGNDEDATNRYVEANENVINSTKGAMEDIVGLMNYTPLGWWDVVKINMKILLWGKVASEPVGESTVPVVEPFDPNDILGPEGYGDARWIAGDRIMDYTIRFENDEELASAPAQKVIIEQLLDKNLDIRTFRLGSFGFSERIFNVPENRSFYQTRLDLVDEIGMYVDVNAGIDIVTGKAFWIFQSINPETGAAVTDALTGFLPPDVIEGEGQGFVTYYIKPNSTSKTGDIIDAEASIIFDENEPIDTPPIFNTLDLDLPKSTIEKVNSTKNGDILITWSGSDGIKGSGIRSVDLYVSIDYGDFILAQSGIVENIAIYPAKSGHVYRFFIVAKDNVGNREALKSSAEAEISMHIPGIPTEILLEVEYENVKADGISTSEITAIVKDSEGNLVKGVDVLFTATNGTLDADNVTTDENGIATVVFTSSETPGKVTVTATVGDISSSVYIEQYIEIVPTGLLIEPGDLSIGVGETIDTVVSIEYSDNTREIVTEDVEYESQDESIAEVDENGVIKGISEGGTTISVTYKEFTTEISVTVKEKVFKIELSAKAELNSIELSWEEVPEAIGYDIEVDGDIIELTETTYLHTGLVPDTLHTYRVRARFDDSDVGEWSESKTVSTLSEEIEIVPTELLVEPEDLSIEVGETIYAVVSIEYSDSTREIVTEDIEYLSQDKSIAEVDENGVIKGISEGSTIISVTYKEFTTEIRVTVKEKVFKIELSAKAELNSIELSWEEAPEAIGYDIEVDGDIIGLAETTYLHTGLVPDTLHTYRVRARFDSHVGEWSEAKTVSTLSEEIKIVPTGLLIEPEELSIEVGETIDTVVSIEYSDNTSEIVTEDIEYLSQDESIAEVDENGVIKGISEGSTTISITYKEFTTEISVTVKKEVFKLELSAKSELNSIELSWEEVPEAIGYDIEVDGDIIELTETTYLHTGLEPDTLHTYRVRARFDTYVGEWSESKTVSTLKKDAPPAATPPVRDTTPSQGTPEVVQKPVEEVPGRTPEDKVSKIDETGTITVKPKIDEGSKTAISSVTDNDLKDAFEKAKVDESGVKKVIIEVEKIEGVSQYEQQIVVSKILQEGDYQNIEIRTPIATLELHDNMFKSKDIKDAQNISIVVSRADVSNFDTEQRSKIGDRPVIKVEIFANGKVVKLENKDVPLQISVDYIPKPKELDNTDRIIVWQIKDDGKQSMIPTARYNNTTGKITFSTNSTGTYAVAFGDKTFNDIDNYPWAKNQIEMLASRGIISGTSDTTYSPANNIKRADAVILIVKALGLNTEFSTNFEDVKDDKYYYEAVGIAKGLGIITGVGGNRFDPETPITRQDLIVIVNRALNVSGKGIEGIDDSKLKEFNDYSEISSYALDSVSALVKEEIIMGDNGNIAPLRNVTRAEMAVIIYRVYKMVYNF